MLRIITATLVLLVMGEALCFAQVEAKATQEASPSAVDKLQQEIAILRLQNRRLRAASLRAAAYLKAHQGDERVIAALEEAVRFRADPAELEKAAEESKPEPADTPKVEMEKPAPPKPKDEPVNSAGDMIHYGKLKFMQTPDGFAVTGQYTNNGESRILVKLTITTYNPDGSELETASVMVPAIEQYKLQDFRIPLTKLPPEGQCKIVAETDRTFE